MSVDTATEGARRFTAAWRKERVDAARHRQEKERGNEIGKVVIIHGRTGEATPFVLVDKSKESCTGSRQT